MSEFGVELIACSLALALARWIPDLRFAALTLSGMTTSTYALSRLKAGTARRMAHSG